MGAWVRYFDDYEKAVAFYRNKESVVKEAMIHRPIATKNIHYFNHEAEMLSFEEDMEYDNAGANAEEKHLFMYTQKDEIFGLKEMGIHTFGDWERKHRITLHIVQAKDNVYSSVFLPANLL